MSNSKSLLSLCLLTISVFSFAQISEVELIPDGIVFPRMNTAQRNALSPAQGQCIFNTQTKSLECFDGTQWSSNSASGSSSAIIDGDGDTSIELEQNPDEDIIRFHANGLEVMNHDGQTLQFTNNGQSVFVGENAGAADDLSNNRNTFVGSLAGQANTNGTQNVAVGHQAMKDNILGSSNIALGQQALQKNKNSNNIAIGFNAARDNNNGNKNIAIGGYSGFTNQNGNQNTFVGYEAGRNTSTTTSGSVMIGHQAGMNETDDNRLYIANDNTAVPLVYGEFENKQLKINGRLAATNRINVGDDSSTPETGDIRYNVNTEDFEGWNGYQWLSLTKKSPEYGISVRDSDFNYYRTIKLGTQLWMAENLKVTTYNDGTVIPNITGDTDWSNLISGAWCHYDNDPNYDDVYGKLYNAHAIQTDKLCPNGWHIPSQTELFTLISYLGYDGTGGKMKEAGLGHWNSPNTAANDASGFSGLPGGQRNNDGSFSDLNSLGIWWQDLSSSSTFEFKYMLEADDHGLPVSFTTSTKNGLSVRCLKD